MVEEGPGPSSEGEAPREEFPGSEQRRRLVRQAGLWAGLMFLAAGLVAAVGGGVLAWLLARQLEASFWKTWLILVAVLLGIPLAGHGIMALVERRRRRR